MVSRRSLSAGAVVMLAGVTVLLVYLYWHILVSVLVLLVAGRLAWGIIASHAGLKRRPKSSWSSLIRTGAIAFGAWNTRYFKPRVEAKIPASADGIPKPDAEFGEVPF